MVKVVNFVCIYHKFLRTVTRMKNLLQDGQNNLHSLARDLPEEKIDHLKEVKIYEFQGQIKVIAKLKISLCRRDSRKSEKLTRSVF